MNGRLLLLDLDGVTVLEAGPPLVERLEILRLHRDLAAGLAAFDAPVVVLTHRSQREARRILHAAGVGDAQLAGVAAAEDLFRAGLRHDALRMLGRGLRKSLFLPLVERRFGVDRGRAALIDDRLDNLEDMAGAGLGLALHAPCAADAAGLTTFDLAEAARLFNAWSPAAAPRGPTPLVPVTLPMQDWRRTGLDTAREGRHAFNRVRTLARHIRTRLTARR